MSNLDSDSGSGSETSNIPAPRDNPRPGSRYSETGRASSRDSSRASTHGTGGPSGIPLENKGKGIDPRNFGNLGDADGIELDAEVQRITLQNIQDRQLAERLHAEEMKKAQDHSGRTLNSTAPQPTAAAATPLETAGAAEDPARNLDHEERRDRAHGYSRLQSKPRRQILKVTSSENKSGHPTVLVTHPTPPWEITAMQIAVEVSPPRGQSRTTEAIRINNQIERERRERREAERIALHDMFRPSSHLPRDSNLGKAMRLTHDNRTPAVNDDEPSDSSSSSSSSRSS